MTKDHIINGKKDISFKVIAGGIFAILGLASLSMYIGYFFILVAVVILFYNSGIEFDFSANKVRCFNSYFGYTKGNWKNLDEFHCIYVKRTRKGFRTYSRSNTSSVDTINTRYEVLLMSKKYIDSILLFDSGNKNEAYDFAETWSAKIGVSVFEKP